MATGLSPVEATTITGHKDTKMLMRPKLYMFELHDVPIMSIRRFLRTAFGNADIQLIAHATTTKMTRYRTASWMIQNGQGLEKVGLVLRHADIAITQIYAHLENEQAREAVASLECSETEALIWHSVSERVS